VQANSFREDLRGKGVWIFCVFREFIKRAGELGGLGEDAFMMTFDELFAYLKGDASAAAHVAARRKTYEEYLTYEPFPNIILGRFDPKAWMADPNRRSDAFVQGMELEDVGDAQVKGFRTPRSLQESAAFPPWWAAAMRRRCCTPATKSPWTAAQGW